MRKVWQVLTMAALLTMLGPAALAAPEPGIDANPEVGYYPCPQTQSVTANWSVYASGTGWSVKYTSGGAYSSNRPISDHSETYTYYPLGSCSSWTATFRAMSTGWPSVYDSVRTTYSVN